MKILIMINSNDTGGAEKQARMLAENLTQNGQQVELMFLRRPITNSTNHLINNKVVTTTLNFPRNFANPKYLINIIRFGNKISKESYDIIHTFLPEAAILISLYNFIAKHKIPHIAGIRGEFISGLCMKRKIYGFALHQSDFVICNSNSLKNSSIQKYFLKKEKIKVIPNGIRIAPQKRRILHTPLKAIVVSNLHPYKGYDLLFSALAEISSYLEIHVVGRGEFHERFQNDIIKIPKNITLVFRGEINALDIYSDFDFAIHPSRTEGSSNVILEALAHELPVIAFNIESNKELIKTHENGYLVEKLNSEALRDAINFFISDPKYILKLAKNTHSRLKKYTFNYVALETHSIYETVCERFTKIDKN